MNAQSSTVLLGYTAILPYPYYSGATQVTTLNGLMQTTLPCTSSAVSPQNGTSLQSQVHISNLLSQAWVNYTKF